MPAKIPPVAPLADVEPWSRRAPAVRVALLLATHQPPALPALPDVRAAQDDLSVELLEGEGVVHGSFFTIHLFQKYAAEARQARLPLRARLQSFRIARVYAF